MVRLLRSQFVVKRKFTFEHLNACTNTVQAFKNVSPHVQINLIREGIFYVCKPTYELHKSVQAAFKRRLCEHADVKHVNAMQACKQRSSGNHEQSTMPTVARAVVCYQACQGFYLLGLFC